MKNLSLFFGMVLGAALSFQPAQAEGLPASGAENTDSAVIEGEVPEGTVEEDLHLLEEGEDGKITERGLRRFHFKKKSRKRLTIPNNSKQKIIPHQKFRLKPKSKIPPKKRPFARPPTGDQNKPNGGGIGRPPIDLRRYVPNQVIVKLRPGMSLPFSTLHKFGLQRLRTTSGGHILFRFAVPPGLEKLRNPLTVAKELAKHAAVIFTQPNTIYTPDRVPQDELFPHQWHYFENGSGAGQSSGGIGLPKVWDRTRGNRGVVVAVIDTGIVTVKDHPDLIGTGNLLPGFDFISDPAKASDGDGRDADPTDLGDGTAFGKCIPGVKGSKDSWHGTNVAGVIGMGRTNGTEGIAGVNWLVSVLPIRVSGKCGADDFDLYDAIKWAAGLPVPEAPPNTNPARIINISLGSLSPCEKLIQEAIDEVITKKGASIVTAAGNETTLAAFHSPSNCKNVITVAASNEQGHLAQYSNFGSPVTIMAPGGNRKQDKDKDGMPDGVLTLNHPTLRFPKTAPLPLGYSLEMGTSLAAPHVSGVLALWLAVDFSLTHADLLQGLKDNAIPRNKTQCPRACGAGLLNADLSSLIPPGKPVQPPPPKGGPPPKQPPPVAQCKVKTSEIVHSMKIDIGNNDSQTTSAKQALLRMLIHGDVEVRRDASGMVKATENGTLAGIFQRNKGPVAARGQRMTPPKGWWELIPQGQLGMCLKDPAGEPPMIIYKQQEMAPSTLDDMLRNAWHQCGLPELEFPCVYEKDMEDK